MHRWEEYELGTRCLGFVELYREVGLGVVGESFGRNNFNALFLGFLGKVVVNARRISIRAIVNYGNLGGKFVFCDVVGRFCTLVRIGEAHLENVVVFDNSGSRS